MVTRAIAARLTISHRASDPFRLTPVVIVGASATEKRTHRRSDIPSAVALAREGLLRKSEPSPRELKRGTSETKITARYCGPSAQFSSNRAMAAIRMPLRMDGIADHVRGVRLITPIQRGTVTGMATRPSTMLLKVKMPMGL